MQGWEGGGGGGNFGTPAARLEPGITIGARKFTVEKSQTDATILRNRVGGKGSVGLGLNNSNNPESRAVKFTV